MDTLTRYEVHPRPAELGGGWRLYLYEDDVDVGGGVFPADPADKVAMDAAYADALETGESWLQDDALSADGDRGA